MAQLNSSLALQESFGSEFCCLLGSEAGVLVKLPLDGPLSRLELALGLAQPVPMASHKQTPSVAR
jgi:hypothetical protein